MNDSTSQTGQETSAALRAALAAAVERGASDLHVVAGHPPTLRLHGRLREMPNLALTEGDIEPALEALCPPDRWRQFQTEKNLDFALELQINGLPCRFRVNYFVNGEHCGGCFRVIPPAIPSFGWAGFPVQVAERLTRIRNGLILFSGVTGAGKTTSLAMIINLMLGEGGLRVITVEEPVEYVFPTHGDSIITQREVGRDVCSFADGLKYGVRQDPDVILVGEIRDKETAQMALSAAETGHLVFSTLHTRDAKGAISRYADFFPQNVQGEVRGQLSQSLQAVICQHLLPSTSGEKRELALEILFRNSPMASAIRNGKTDSIDRIILTSRADGMITFDESIKRLLQAQKIDWETAERYVTDTTMLGR